jgi:hypothetical protein
MNKKLIKNIMLVIMFAAITFNTAGTCILTMWMSEDRESLKKLETDICELKDKLEAETDLRKKLYPELKKSAGLLKKYNPALDDLTTLKYAYKIFQCTDEYVSLDILTALIVVESSANTRAESNKGALGLTQVMPNIWKYDKSTLINPYRNIEAGSSILSYYVKRYGLKGGLSAYNSGKRSGSPKYARKVIGIASRYF